MTIMEALDAKLGNESPSMTIMEALGGQGGMTIAEAVEASDIQKYESASVDDDSSYASNNGGSDSEPSEDSNE